MPSKASLTLPTASTVASLARSGRLCRGSSVMGPVWCWPARCAKGAHPRPRPGVCRAPHGIPRVHPAWWSLHAASAKGQLVLVAVAVDHDGVAVADLTREEGGGQAVADLALHQPAQRPGAVGRVVAGEGQPLARRLGDLEGDPA